MIEEIFDRYPDEEFLRADGFDAAIIGVDTQSMRLIYSTTKVLQILIDGGMTFEEAQKYFDFNIYGAYVGEKTPIWCEDDYQTEEDAEDSKES